MREEIFRYLCNESSLKNSYTVAHGGQFWEMRPPKFKELLENDVNIPTRLVKRLAEDVFNSSLSSEIKDGAGDHSSLLCDHAN